MKYFYVIALILLMASCDQIQEGTIVDIVAEPAHTYTSISYHSVGKSSYAVPQTHFVDPEWKIRIRGKLEGKTKYRTIYVTQYDYETLALGQYYKVRNH